MEEEINYLAHRCRELFPIVYMVDLLSDAVYLSMKKPVELNVTFHKENYGAFVLAQNDPPKYTP